MFFVEKGQIKVLQLERNDGTNEVGPKGHIEKGESEVRTAHREIKEEIGVGLHLDTHFRSVIDYRYERVGDGKTSTIHKKSVFFVAFIHAHERKNLSLSKEHRAFRFVPIEKAIEELRYGNQKELLAAAQEYITLKYLT